MVLMPQAALESAQPWQPTKISSNENETVTCKVLVVQQIMLTVHYSFGVQNPFRAPI